MINVNACGKSITRAKYYSWFPNTCFCENNKYLKSIVDFSGIMCDDIINVANRLPRNVTKTVSTNVTSTAPINSGDKK